MIGKYPIKQKLGKGAMGEVWLAHNPDLDIPVAIKTLPTYLAPLVVGAQRPLLLVPAKLREKTHRDFASLRDHWQEGAPIEVMSYEWLGRANAADFLEGFKPDLIMGDGDLSAFPRRDAGPDPLVFKGFAIPIGIVAAIC